MVDDVVGADVTRDGAAVAVVGDEFAWRGEVDAVDVCVAVVRKGRELS